MATELWLVRHGQAAFGSGDYDRLTDLGWQQARWLGEHLAAMETGFDRIAAGTLRRQQETASALTENLGGGVETVPGLEEYDGDALLRAIGVTEGQKLGRREHFRVLRGAILDWSEDRLGDVPETWGAFRKRVLGAVEALTSARRGRVLAASSGGAIAMAITALLGMPPAQMVEMNLQARNTGISRLIFTGGRVYLNQFNAVPHLEHPDRKHAETYS